MIRTASVLAILAAAGTASAQQLSVLLEVDLSVENQVTITATDGVSAATITGSSTVGFYLDNAIDGSAGIGDTLVSGDLTSASELSDGTPDLFNGFGDGSGLNVFSYADGGASSNFTAGEIAFSGSGTWDISAAAYASFAAPGTTGLIYFPADDDGDLAGAEILGELIIVPAPVAGALLAMGGLVAVRRRRA